MSPLAWRGTVMPEWFARIARAPLTALMLLSVVTLAQARDLAEILEQGVIRHLGFAQVKLSIAGRTVLAMENTCLDPGLCGLEQTGARVRLQPPDRTLNEMIPAILNKDAEATLLDVPDALVGLQRWPGQIKVIGPISSPQLMAAAFRISSPALRQAFNQYLRQIRADGTYHDLVRKYYPAVFRYYGEFFSAAG